jgi:hypothetical protein
LRICEAGLLMRRGVAQVEYDEESGHIGGIMKSQYFCAYHAERLRACESEAYRHWAEMMQRGAQAYSECRFEAANLYLGAAMDIGLLRHGCEGNGLFTTFHIMKPAEFLLEAQLLEQRHDAAENTLHKLSSIAKPDGDWLMLQLVNFLSKGYARVEWEGKCQVTQPTPAEVSQLH